MKERTCLCIFIYDALIHKNGSRVGVGYISDTDTLRYAVDTCRSSIEHFFFKKKKKKEKTLIHRRSFVIRQNGGRVSKDGELEGEGGSETWLGGDGKLEGEEEKRRKERESRLHVQGWIGLTWKPPQLPPWPHTRLTLHQPWIRMRLRNGS